MKLDNPLAGLPENNKVGPAGFSPAQMHAAASNAAKQVPGIAESQLDVLLVATDIAIATGDPSPHGVIAAGAQTAVSFVRRFATISGFYFNDKGDEIPSIPEGIPKGEAFQVHCKFCLSLSLQAPAAPTEDHKVKYAAAISLALYACGYRYYELIAMMSKLTAFIEEIDPADLEGSPANPESDPPTIH